MCAARLADARRDRAVAVGARDAAAAGVVYRLVMARIGQEKWQTERVVDIGFNLAIAAGVLVILAGGAGLAWSLGFFTVTIDTDALMRRAAIAGRRPRDQSASDDRRSRRCY